MKNKIFLTTALMLMIGLTSTAQQLNEISTAPLSFLFRNVQLIYERQIDSSVIIGAQGRYYFSAPPSDYDSIKSNGGDISFFIKFCVRKKPGGLYMLLGATCGKYNIAAGYGHQTPGWFGGEYVTTSVEPKSFFTVGGKASLGYKIVIDKISLDFSAGAKFLLLPSEVTEPVNGNILLHSWGKYSWTEIASPGSIFLLGITTGYRF